MDASLQPLLEQIGPDRVGAFFLVLARVSPLFILAPLFSSKLVPGRVRGIVAVGLALGLSPVAAQGVVLPTDQYAFAALLGKEVLVGLGFAFALGALFAAMTIAGSFLDTMIGFSFGSLVDPVTGNQSTVLQQLYSLIAVLVFIAIGGDAWVIRGLARTYDVVGLLDYPQLNAMVSGAADAFAQIFLAAIQVAGPVILALTLTDAAFGVVSRVVPQLNVFQVGFPAKVLVGLLLIGVSLPFVAGWLADELQRDVSAALATLRIAE
ncbi:Flagellar biosynthetic protein FliR [Paraconexibacter sp. AEG42_29]|uniref:Flagellar biosynthetic protein FliR n=1 Tax=Paraconexibacter sp. AEG42_29 TaxID=2997339 RepID=A0AAU7ANW3_9ACTN